MFSYRYLYHPLNAQIEITSRCNARCVFCSIWQKEYQKNCNGEMNTDDIKKILNEMNRLGVFVISWTGGEPTLRKDLPELLRYSQKLGMMNTVTTNGYYLYDMIKAGQLDGAEIIIVSLDWPDAEHHDKYRQIQVFDRAIKGIRAAILEHKHIWISMVVTKDNMPYMEEMCKFTHKLGAMIEMLPCEDIIREMDDEEHVVDDIDSYIPDLKEWAKEVRRLMDIYPNLTTDTVTISVIEGGGFGNQDLLHCVMSEAYIFIRYNGEYVLPCKIHPIWKVDVIKHSLYKAYYSVEAKKIMKMEDKFPFCLGCRLGCGIATSIPRNISTVYEKYVKAFLNGNFF